MARVIELLSGPKRTPQIASAFKAGTIVRRVNDGKQFLIAQVGSSELFVQHNHCPNNILLVCLRTGASFLSGDLFTEYEGSLEISNETAK